MPVFLETNLPSRADRILDGLHASPHALFDDGALEFGERPRDLEQELAHQRGGVSRRTRCNIMAMDNRRSFSQPINCRTF